MDDNSSGQMHVLEAVTVCVILLVSILFLSYLSAPPSVHVFTPNQLKILGDDLLRSLDLMPTSDGSYHDSMLTQYILTNPPDYEDFTAFAEAVLPSNTFYHVWIVNGTTRSLWYPTEALDKFGEVVKSHRVIIYDGSIYDIELEMWYV